jgi:hypothetical protein
MTTTLIRHDITWHDMMTTWWSRCTQFIMILKKKIKLIVISWRHTASTTTSVNKFWHSTSRPARTYMRSATHMIPRHGNMRCNTMTTSQHKGSLTTLHDKCQHANSNHLTTACYKKLYDKFIYTSERNNLYNMISSICNTWRQTFFTWFDEADLRRETHRFPALCKTHYPRWRTNIDTYRQQTKTKVPHKESSMRNRTQQASLVILQVTDRLKHGSRFMTYTAYAQVNASQGGKHYHKNIFTMMMFLMGWVWQWDKIIVDSQGLKRGHFWGPLLWSKIGPFTDHKNVTLKQDIVLQDELMC